MVPVEVKILKKKAPPPDAKIPLKERVLADLEGLSAADAFAFALPEEGAGHVDARARKGLPGTLIFLRLRAAGMRIEVAWSFGEAMNASREMGLELSGRQSLDRQVVDIFPDAGKHV